MNSFLHILNGLKDKHIYIQTHNFPDPDAIASAYGLQVLLKHNGITSTICYKGNVEHGSVSAMLKRMEIDVVEYSDIKKMDEESEIVLVDAQKGNSNILDMRGDEVMCIDHHPTFEKIEYVFSDIRPEVGACASIIAEYFFNNNIKMDEKTATALLYGIKCDTANLTRGVSDLDLNMFYQIYNKANLELITELENSVLKLSDLKAYEIAINSLENFKGITFASVGSNCPESLIATISDFIMLLDTTHTSIVYSLKNAGIKLSLRTISDLNVGKIINEALEGIGNGGGHEKMAGGFVPYDAAVVNPLENIEYINSIINEIKVRITKKIGT